MAQDPRLLDPIAVERQLRAERQTREEIERRAERQQVLEEYGDFERAMRRAFKGIFPGNYRRQTMIARVKRRQRDGA